MTGTNGNAGNSCEFSNPMCCPIFKLYRTFQRISSRPQEEIGNQAEVGNDQCIVAVVRLQVGRVQSPLMNPQTTSPLLWAAGILCPDVRRPISSPAGLGGCG